MRTLDKYRPPILYVKIEINLQNIAYLLHNIFKYSGSRWDAELYGVLSGFKVFEKS